jgi:large conductance mechanosensitive channel
VIGIFFYEHATMPYRECPHMSVLFSIPIKSIRQGRQPVRTAWGFTHVKGFREFLTRGNLIELAVAVVIGTAFTAIVTAIVADLITPLIAAIGGKPDFSSLTFTINHSTFRYGAFLNALISFLIIAAVVYFLVVKPMAALLARMTRAKAATERGCPECLSSIPIAARRCKYCTAQVASPAAR